MSEERELTGKHNLDRQPHGPSQLFLLRVWESDLPGERDWQGVLQQTVTGESRAFRSCEELRNLIFEFVSPRPGSHPNSI